MPVWYRKHFTTYSSHICTKTPYYKIINYLYMLQHRTVTNVNPTTAREAYPTGKLSILHSHCLIPRIIIYKIPYVFCL